MLSMKLHTLNLTRTTYYCNTNVGVCVKVLGEI